MELSSWSTEESSPYSFPGRFPRLFLPPSDSPQIQGLSKKHLCLGYLGREGLVPAALPVLSVFPPYIPLVIQCWMWDL